MGKFSKLFMPTCSVWLFFHLCPHQHLVLPNFLINGKQLVITQHLFVVLICFPLVTRTLSIFQMFTGQLCFSSSMKCQFIPAAYFSIVFDFYYIIDVWGMEGLNKKMVDVLYVIWILIFDQLQIYFKYIFLFCGIAIHFLWHSLMNSF